MKYRHLLAKSSQTPDAPRDAETLAGHSRNVVAIAQLLARDHGAAMLATLDLPIETALPDLIMALPRAALLHDLGKGNSDFQRMVRTGPNGPTQAFRHEFVSAWLALQEPLLADWLFAGCSEWLRDAIVMAVVGHHLKIGAARDFEPQAGSGNIKTTIFVGHNGFAEVLSVGAELLKLAPPPKLADRTIDLLDDLPLDPLARRWLSRVQGDSKTVDARPRRFIAMLKALLIAADVAASALPRRQVNVEPVTWAKEALAEVCTADELDLVVQTRLKGKEPRAFQHAVANSDARVTFVRAGCGSGKTLAAYMWASRRATGRKLFICYPTTGTASQGFSDYVPLDLIDANLSHSRATVDLEDLPTNETRDGRDRRDALIRMEALAIWDTRVTVCTVDTVLGAIQNNRRGLFAFPAIAKAAFVFDEIHQYDERLFDALMRFLTEFGGAPVLLMTASLPRDRLDRLRSVVGESLEMIDGPPELETLLRYRLTAGTEEETRTLVAEKVRAGCRVLWVSNTVNRAKECARWAEANNLSMLPYHSRYRYEDRLQRHKNVVDAFEGESKGGVVATTTQVCEVSLDLSADLLITDLAPIPALIQRLGRLNRRATPEKPGSPATAIVISPPNSLPYEPNELDDARTWLNELSDRDISQADLAQAFERRVGVRPAGVSNALSAWLDDGVYAKPASLREEGTTIPIIREEDESALVNLSRDEAARMIVRMTVPMPIGPVAGQIGGWRRAGGALVAPKGVLTYEERFGGEWR